MPSERPQLQHVPVHRPEEPSPRPTPATSTDGPAPAVARTNGNLTDIEEHLVSVLTPDSFEAEQYRALRTSLEALRQPGTSLVLAVSSPAEGDGKTTTAINLSAALGQGGQAKVLLVDVDLRSPAVAAELGMNSGRNAGLVDAILGESVHLQDVVCRRSPLWFDFVGAGRRVSSPYELLKSDRFVDLLQQARSAYDYVVLDTPPLVSFADCQVMGGSVDGFLIVVAAHRTPRKLLEEALNRLDQSKVLGMVFNRDDRPLSGYGYAYSYLGASRKS
jgi:capsular exopolysaccharide synthesis family protein